MMYSGGVNAGSFSRYNAPQPERPVHPHPASGQDVLLKKPKNFRQNEAARENYLLSDGGALYEKAEAYTKYSPSAVHVSTEPVKSGKALKADDKLLIEQKSLMEYQPTDQVIETNYHVSGRQKLSEADRILAEAKKRREAETSHKNAEPVDSFKQILPYILTAAGGGALAGLVTKSLLLTVGSLAAGAGALYYSGGLNGGDAPQGKSDMRKKLSAFS